MDQILSAVRAFDGVFELAPEIGSDHPEVSWGDHFFYYSPSGELPINRQPYATIVTKDYPDDTGSRLDEPGRWRVNVHVGADRAAALTARGTDAPDEAVDVADTDVFLPHPLYGSFGWVAVVNPGRRTADELLTVLQDAHDDDRRRVERRSGA